MSADFTSFLRSLGLRPGIVAPDGKWRRCRTDDKPKRRNGAYVLDQYGGAAINYATMTERALWRPDHTEVPDYDPRALHEALRRQQREQDDAIAEARRFVEACAPLRNSHPYLARKGLDMTGAFGLRVCPEGWLVVPAYRDGRLVSYQRIHEDGTKRFAPGAPMRGATYTLERLQPTIHIVCEGLATGMALYAAVPHSRVIVAFTAGGLQAGAELLPPGMCCIASDNDHLRPCLQCRENGATAALDPRGPTPEGCKCNPGLRAALAASSAVGAGLAVPDALPGCTDWNDVLLYRLDERLTAWNRKPHDTDVKIRRAVTAALAMQLQRAAVFRAPYAGG